MEPRADELAVAEDDQRRIAFLVAAHGLTSVLRFNRLLDGTRGETSAEHSWHLALTALLLHQQIAPDVDLVAVLAMLLVHDVVEVDAGDVPIYDHAARDAAVADEEHAAERLFGLLPPIDAERLRECWNSFERAETPEARFARAVDRFQPILVHWAGDGSAWRERQVTVAQDRAIVELVADFWPPLAPLASALVDDARHRGMLADQRHRHA